MGISKQPMFEFSISVRSVHFTFLDNLNKPIITDMSRRLFNALHLLIIILNKKEKEREKRKRKKEYLVGICWYNNHVSVNNN
jgi:hypothetical protein